jgi:hypothetical protein
MASEIRYKECFCAFVQSMGTGLTSEVNTFITSIISLLTAIRAELQLVNGLDTLEDQARKELAELALTALQTTTDPIASIFSVLNSYTAPFADCPPVQGMSRAIKETRDYILSEVDDLEYQIQMWGVALDEKDKEIEWIESLITQLEEIQKAIDECGGTDA